jgi:hypothetical protein
MSLLAIESEEHGISEEIGLTLLDKMEQVTKLLYELVGEGSKKAFYSTAEFAKLKGLEPKTVRDNLNAGRLSGVKRRDGHGRSQKWAIPHVESERYDREGLLPLRE